MSRFRLHGTAAMNISKKILADPVNRWIFKQADEIYLVGGYVRDLLRGIKPKDRDFVVRGDAGALARKAMTKYGGTFIELFRHQAYRVVFRDGSCIDFTVMQKDIFHDLSERDFTVNAIAWSPESGLIAPDGHLDDLKQGIIKAVDPINLLKDPLRVLRAYRFAAQLGFSIERQTRSYLKKYAHDLDRTSAERITEEFIHILNNALSHIYLKLTAEDKVIYEVISISNQRCIMNISFIEEFDKLLIRSQLLKNKTFASYIKSTFSQGLTRAGLIRLALLVHERKQKKADRTENRLKRLRLSTRTKRALAGLCAAETTACIKPDDTHLFHIFYDAWDTVYESALVRSILLKWDIKRAMEHAVWFLKIKDRDLLRGDEIAALLDIPPCQKISDIKRLLKEKQFDRTIHNRADARKWILSNLT